MDWMNLIPWGLTFMALIVSALSFIRNKHNDELQGRVDIEAKMERLNESLLKANIKLDQVCATTNETRSDIKALNTSLIEMDKRLSVVENDLKTAFMRIDELREDMKNGMDK
jgi:septal ring factor EnvC (AmiA/AmiB activator)